MRNRIFALLIVSILAATMIACNSGASTTDTASEQIEDVEIAASGDSIGSVTEAKDEETIEDIKQVAEECAPSIDITDCGTFTDLLNKKRIETGMGYANVDVGSINCFFVTSGTYDNMDGNMASIDSEIFIYVDGNLTELGKVCSGGTAYPIATKGGYIYTAGNHWVCKYVIEDNQLKIMEKASVTYGEDGSETYFYDSEDGGDYSKINSDYASEIMNQLYEEMSEATVVNYDTVVE